MRSSAARTRAAATATGSARATPTTSPSTPNTASATIACRSSGPASSPRRAGGTRPRSSTTAPCSPRRVTPGVAPWVCLHHFTLPGWFTEIGDGAFCDDHARSYHWARHVAFCAETFGDLVFGWKPINEPFGYAALSYQLGVLPPRRRNFDQMLDAYRGILLAQRDAWRELRGAGTPVATIHNLSPLFPVDDSVPAEQNTRDIDALMWGVWMRADRDGVLALPGRAAEEIADLRECCDLIGFSYYSANAVGRDRRFSPYPRGARVGPLGYAPWSEGLGHRAPAAARRAPGPAPADQRARDRHRRRRLAVRRAARVARPSPRRRSTTGSTSAASSSGPASTTTSGRSATTSRSGCSTGTVRPDRVPSSRRSSRPPDRASVVVEIVPTPLARPITGAGRADQVHRQGLVRFRSATRSAITCTGNRDRRHRARRDGPNRSPARVEVDVADHRGPVDRPSSGTWIRWIAGAESDTVKRVDRVPASALDDAPVPDRQSADPASGSSSMMRPVPTARPSTAPTGSCSRTRRFSFGSIVRSPRTRTVTVAERDTKPAGTVTVPDCAP